MSPVARRLLWASLLAQSVVLYLPMALLLIFSFNDSVVPAFPLDRFTLRWYAELGANEELLGSLRSSVAVATASSVVALALAFPASLALVRRRFRGAGLVYGLLLSPLVIPYGVFGISLVLLFYTIALPLSLVTVTIGHVVLALPFVVLVLVPRLQSLDVGLEEAARDLGASPAQTFLRVTLPLMLPAVVSAFLIAFTISFDEYVVASFLVGTETTFPIYLVSQLRFPTRLPQAIAASVALIFGSLALVGMALLARWTLERSLGSAGARTRTTIA